MKGGLRAALFLSGRAYAPMDIAQVSGGRMAMPASRAPCELEHRAVAAEQAGAAELQREVDELLVVRVGAAQARLQRPEARNDRVRPAIAGRDDRRHVGSPRLQRTAREHMPEFLVHRSGRDPQHAAGAQRIGERAAARVAKQQPVENDVGVEHQPGDATGQRGGVVDGNHSRRM